MYPGNDPKYASIPKAADVRTESLKVSELLTLCALHHPCSGWAEDVRVVTVFV